MHRQEEVGPPEIGHGCISITLIDSMWDWSLGIPDSVYPLDFLLRSGKLPYG